MEPKRVVAVGRLQQPSWDSQDVLCAQEVVLASEGQQDPNIESCVSSRWLGSHGTVSECQQTGVGKEGDSSALALILEWPPTPTLACSPVVGAPYRYPGVVPHYLIYVPL